MVILVLAKKPSTLSSSLISLLSALALAGVEAFVQVSVHRALASGPDPGNLDFPCCHGVAFFYGWADCHFFVSIPGFAGRLHCLSVILFIPVLADRHRARI